MAEETPPRRQSITIPPPPPEVGPSETSEERQLREMTEANHNALLNSLSIERKNFEEGVQYVLSHVLELFKRGQRFIVISIHGACAHVGKTFLKEAFGRELTMRGINCTFAKEIDNISSDSVRQLMTSQKLSFSHQAVLILGDCNIDVLRSNNLQSIEEKKRERDEILARHALAAGLTCTKIDIAVGIERPDKLFPGTMTGNRGIPLVDIIITNEQAKDKASQTI